MNLCRHLLNKMRASVCGPEEGHRLGQLAVVLAKATSLQEMKTTVCEQCKEVLLADAICLYLWQPAGFFEMVCEIGCTEEFKSKFKFVNKDFFPPTRGPHPEEGLFFGTAQDLERDVPSISGLIQRSKRHTIAYGPLVVNQNVIGILGFSYNHAQNALWKRDFVKVLLNLCALAIDRMRLFENEQLARHEAEAANASKNDFLAMISHEIRTPAGVIQGFADVLAGSPGLSLQQQRWASIVAKNSRQLTEIIGDVLDISKIEAKLTEFHPEKVNLIGLLEDVFAAYEPLSRQKGLKLQFDYRKASRYVFTDSLQLRQILINLISNALKFTLKGSVEVKVCTNSNRLRAWVKDTGIGIPDDKRHRIFDPFIQAESSTSRRFGGFGLGLTIAKKLAKAQGGDLILVESTAEHGSTFFVDIPVEIQSTTDATEQIREPDHAHAKLSGIHVLLVEDFLDNQELIKYLLENEGAVVEVAESGESGVKLALQKDYDVILMDIQMPKMDGYEAVATLRKKGYTRPIAALTAHALRNEKMQSKDKGFDDYLTKPINLPVLVNTIKRLALTGAPTSVL